MRSLSGLFCTMPSRPVDTMPPIVRKTHRSQGPRVADREIHGPIAPVNCLVAFRTDKFVRIA